MTFSAPITNDRLCRDVSNSTHNRTLTPLSGLPNFGRWFIFAILSILKTGYPLANIVIERIADWPVGATKRFLQYIQLCSSGLSHSRTFADFPQANVKSLADGIDQPAPQHLP